MDDWSNIAYLQQGAERQQSAYRALLASDIFMVLAAYDPVLVGAIPLGLESTTNHLEILCAADSVPQLITELEQYFFDAPGFELEHNTDANPPTLTCRFIEQAFTVEIHAQTVAIEEQPAYRRMAVAARLLRIGGDDARRGVQALLQTGIHLEDALAGYFQLSGAPDDALLERYPADYADLEEIVIAAAHRREPYILSN